MQYLDLKKLFLFKQYMVANSPAHVNSKTPQPSVEVFILANISHFI